MPKAYIEREAQFNKDESLVVLKLDDVESTRYVLIVKHPPDGSDISFHAVERVTVATALTVFSKRMLFNGRNRDTLVNPAASAVLNPSDVVMSLLV